MQTFSWLITGFVTRLTNIEQNRETWIAPLCYLCSWLIDWLIFMCLTLLSAIFQLYRRPVLVVEEAGVPERTTDHRKATGKLYHLRLGVECILFVIYNTKPGANPRRIGDRLVWVVSYSNYLTDWATRALCAREIWWNVNIIIMCHSINFQTVFHHLHK